jgi:hypothetical protein
MKINDVLIRAFAGLLIFSAILYSSDFVTRPMTPIYTVKLSEIRNVFLFKSNRIQGLKGEVQPVFYSDNRPEIKELCEFLDIPFFMFEKAVRTTEEKGEEIVRFNSTLRMVFYLKRTRNSIGFMPDKEFVIYSRGELKKLEIIDGK